MYRKVCICEGGMSKRKCVHENELNGETVLGHVPKLMALWLTKFLKMATNKGRAVVKGKRVNRGAGNSMRVLFHRRRVLYSMVKIET